jgi:hypothetical protein
LWDSALASRRIASASGESSGMERSSINSLRVMGVFLSGIAGSIHGNANEWFKK